jgi:cytochrome P450
VWNEINGAGKICEHMPDGRGWCDALGVSLNASTTVDPPAAPYSEAFVQDPYPTYAWFREHAPVAQVRYPNTSTDVWWVTRHADVKRILANPKVFSSDPQHANATTAEASLPFFDKSELILGGVAFADPPLHTHRRKLIGKTFSPRRVEAMRQTVQQVSTELLTAMADGGGAADLMDTFAKPLPVRVIAGQLGVPASDHLYFRRWLDLMISTDPDEFAQAPVAVGEMVGYLSELVAAKRARPGDDLVSAFASSDGDNGFTDVELLGIVFALLVAGYETSSNLIGNGTLALLEHPAQLERLRSQPDLIGPALEEMLRYDSPSTSVVWRFPTEDVEIAGVAIPSGDPVLPMISAANRDAEAFAEPDEFDLARTDLDHVSFGYGPHFCVGAALGRLEVGIALPALLARFPALSLGVSRDELRFRSAFMTRGLLQLPVRW